MRPTHKLLDHVKSPNFKLVFDTGNPVINFDRSNGDALEHVQSSWEFYSHVKEFIYYVHIKDGKFIGRGENGFAKAEFTFPGEGEGDVARIVEDLLRNQSSRHPDLLLNAALADEIGKRNDHVECAFYRLLPQLDGQDFFCPHKSYCANLAFVHAVKVISGFLLYGVKYRQPAVRSLEADYPTVNLTLGLAVYGYADSF